MSSNQDAVIGKNLLKLRSDSGMTQEQLADAMRSRGYKWTKTTVWSIEGGDRALKLYEAKDVLQCLKCDWITYMPVLLGGGDNQRGELEIKRDLVMNRFESTQLSINDLAAAYFDYLLSAAATYNLTDEDRDESEAIEVLEEYSPDSLCSTYWSAIKDQLRAYCLRHKDDVADTSDENSADGYNRAWASVFKLLGNKWIKYIDPDEYYSDDGEG